MNRIFALDELRGLAICIMIFVDAPPTMTYAIFHHAAWEGLTIADLAFPLFVSAMGMSAAVSSSRKIITWQKIFRRTFLIFLLGIILNAITFLLLGLDFANFRVFGILQRLALAYALGMAIVKIFSDDKKILSAAMILLILSSAGFHLYSENPFAQSNNISLAVDLIFPGANHIYTPTGDPEGLYGTLATTASMLFGFLAGRWREKFSWLIIFGTVLLALAGLWSFFDIIAKQIWTAPFALLTSGLNVILFVIFLRTGKFFGAFAAMGKNPLFLFMASNIALIVFYAIGAWTKIFEWMRLEFISVEFNVVIFCLIWVVLWALIGKFLDRLGIVIKL